MLSPPAASPAALWAVLSAFVAPRFGFSVAATIPEPEVPRQVHKVIWAQGVDPRGRPVEKPVRIQRVRLVAPVCALAPTTLVLE